MSSNSKKSKEKKPQLRQYQFNKENPFINQAIKQVKNNIVKKYKTATKTGEKAILKAYDENTGEVLAHTQFIRQVEVDEDKFAKLYLNNFEAFFDLKNNAVKVFGYILNQLTPNKDEFIFLMDDCLEFTKYKTKTSIFDGLAQLIENGIIARGKTDFMYYINPMVAFNGNRISFTKTYVKKKKKSVDPMQVNLVDQIEQVENGEIERI